MGSTASSVHTPAGLIEIRSTDGMVCVTRTRSASSAEKIRDPDFRSVIDTVTIVFPTSDGEPRVEVERRPSAAPAR